MNVGVCNMCNRAGPKILLICGHIIHKECRGNAMLTNCTICKSKEKRDWRVDIDGIDVLGKDSNEMLQAVANYFRIDVTSMYIQGMYFCFDIPQNGTKVNLIIRTINGMEEKMEFSVLTSMLGLRAKIKTSCSIIGDLTGIGGNDLKLAINGNLLSPFGTIETNNIENGTVITVGGKPEPDYINEDLIKNESKNQEQIRL